MLPIIGKKYESATAIEIMKILKSNEVIFNGGAWYLGSSEALPGRVLSYHAQHSLLSIDEVQEAWDKVEAGKREAFIVVAAYEYGTPISHTIIDDKNPAKKEKLTDAEKGTFRALSKALVALKSERSREELAYVRWEMHRWSTEAKSRVRALSACIDSNGGSQPGVQVRTPKMWRWQVAQLEGMLVVASRDIRSQSQELKSEVAKHVTRLRRRLARKRARVVTVREGGSL